MLQDFVKEKLKQNWGERADALDCLAYVKIVGLEHRKQWANFVYAMNPEDEDIVLTINRDNTDCELMEWNLNDLFALFDQSGTYVYIDPDFKPKNIKNILKEPWKY